MLCWISYNCWILILHSFTNITTIIIKKKQLKITFHVGYKIQQAKKYHHTMQAHSESSYTCGRVSLWCLTKGWHSWGHLIPDSHRSISSTGSHIWFSVHGIEATKFSLMIMATLSSTFAINSAFRIPIAGLTTDSHCKPKEIQLTHRIKTYLQLICMYVTGLCELTNCGF